MSLTKKTIKALGWATNLQVIVRLLTFVKIGVIAHFLTPEIYGQFAVIVAYLSIAEAFFELGLPLFFIKLGDEAEKYINTIWTVSIVRGIAIFGIFSFISLILSQFGFNPHLLLFVAAGANPLIKGFINPHIIRFQKELQFNKEFAYRSIVTLLDLLVTFYLAALLQSAYSLIGSMLLVSLVEVSLSWFFSSLRPRWEINKVKIAKVLQFGKWIASANSTSNLVNQLDSIVLNMFLGAGSVGIYQFAQKVTMKPISEGIDVVAKVMFPVLSKISHDEQRLKYAVRRMLVLLIPCIAIGSLILFLFAQPIVLLIAGSEWLEAIVPMKILVLTGLIGSIVTIIYTLLLVTGRVEAITKTTVLRLVIYSLLIVPITTHFGVVGVSSLTLASYLIIILPLFWWSKRIWF